MNCFQRFITSPSGFDTTSINYDVASGSRGGVHKNWTFHQTSPVIEKDDGKAFQLMRFATVTMVQKGKETYQTKHDNCMSCS
jgi:hypothetical protein